MDSFILYTFVKANPFWLFISLPAIILAGHLVPYWIDVHCIRANGVTGPLLARFSDLWLGLVAVHGHRSEAVHELHKKYGTFVRLAPNLVSISDPDAVQVVYGHGNGTLKSEFYDAFLSIRPSIFTTRSRTEHARKRKVISHAFSQKSIVELETYIRLHVGELLEQWDKLYNRSQQGPLGSENEGSWKGHSGRVWFNCTLWFNYWAFDTIGDLAFGSPFGMLRNAKDAAPVALDQKAVMARLGREEVDSMGVKQEVCAIKEVPAVQKLNLRGEYSASMGALPPWVRPVVKLLPWFADGNKAVDDFAGMAIAAVAKRLAYPTDRTDLLSKLREGKDEVGRPMSSEELTAEALTQLIAGSDTVANSSCAITYYLAANPVVQAKLQKELDEAFSASYDQVATYEQVKRLPYLEAVVKEGLRIHSTAGLGLPRIAPEGGLTVCGKTFPPGTILSVPTYTVHHDPDVWGVDVDMFHPERWFERDQARLHKAFNTFSFGPRACVGRNLAMTELLILISSIFRHYDIVLEQPGVPLENQEGFLRKPMECRVGMKRRDS